MAPGAKVKGPDVTESFGLSIVTIFLVPPSTSCRFDRRLSACHGVASSQSGSFAFSCDVYPVDAPLPLAICRVEKKKTSFSLNHWVCDVRERLSLSSNAVKYRNTPRVKASF